MTVVSVTTSYLKETKMSNWGKNNALSLRKNNWELQLFVAARVKYSDIK